PRRPRHPRPDGRLPVPRPGRDGNLPIAARTIPAGRRRPGLAAFILMAALAVLGLAAPAGAAACDPGGGTTVVVDFGALGGGVQTGCAPSAGTGFDALAQAGFDVVRVQSNPAFVCRIDGRPGADTEDCADTPPATGFWSYWTAR